MDKNENVVHYSDLGEIRYIRSNKAKNISIRINQEGDVRVTVPSLIGLRRAEAFVDRKRQWIKSKLSEIGNTAGRWRTIRTGEIIRVRGREIPVFPVKGKESVEDAVWKIVLKEARDYLPGRVEALAAAHGFQYRQVKIRRMKTRWGSCSSGRNINLNSWLVMLPEYLADYVILHELLHTRYRDHGKKFWEALDRITLGKSGELRKELRDQQILKIPANMISLNLNQ